MIVAVLFAVSLVLAVLVSMASFTLGKFLLTLLVSFLAVNIVYILLAFSTCQLVRDREKPIEKENPLCRFAAVTVFEMLCVYLGVKIKVSGMEKLPEDQRFLLVCNHLSGFDPVVMMHKLRRYKLSCIAKPSIMALPVIGRVAYGVGCLSIDRENDRNALKTILTAANYLKKDVCSICIYPEGTRSKTGELGEFHAGSFKIAQRGGTGIVVASISGTQRITKNVPLRRSPVELKILEFIPAEKVKALGTQELSDYSRQLIAESL